MLPDIGLVFERFDRQVGEAGAGNLPATGERSARAGAVAPASVCVREAGGADGCPVEAVRSPHHRLHPAHVGVGIAEREPRRTRDEAWLDGEWGIRLIPKRRTNMRPNTPEEWAGLCQHRQGIETVNSQLAAWGVERLHACTAAGAHLKVLALLVTLAILNAY